MSTYTVYFEIFGKKMKYTTVATSAADAQTQVKNKLHFLDTKKVEDIKMHNYFGDEGGSLQAIKDIFGFK